MILTAAVVVCFAVGAIATAALRDYASRVGLFDTPNHRSSHTTPTPRLGGIAIAAAVLSGWSVLVFREGEGLRSTAVLAGAAVMAVVGVIDDLRAMNPGTKLVGEVLAISIPLIFWEPIAGLDLWSRVLLGLWLLTYTNFFNFMDGSDGLAAGAALCGALGLAALSVYAGTPTLAWMALFVAAATAGFLLHNYPPASIFMGDAGSLLLGYALAVLAVAVWRSGIHAISAVLVLLPFIFDAGFTLARRAVNGERIWHAHRSHLYQRLLGMGISAWQIVWLYWGWSLLCVVLALVAATVGTPMQVIMLLGGTIPGLVLAWQIHHRERARR